MVHNDADQDGSMDDDDPDDRASFSPRPRIVEAWAPHTDPGHVSTQAGADIGASGGGGGASAYLDSQRFR